jgi:hypothetical protein
VNVGEFWKKKLRPKTEKCAKRQKNAPKDRKMRPKTEKCAQRQKNAPKDRKMRPNGEISQNLVTLLNFPFLLLYVHMQRQC